MECEYKDCIKYWRCDFDETCLTYMAFKAGQESIDVEAVREVLENIIKELGAEMCNTDTLLREAINRLGSDYD